IFGFLQEIAARDWESAAERGGGIASVPAAEDAERGAEVASRARQIEAAFDPYFAVHERFRLDPEGRSAKHTHWDDHDAREKAALLVAQVLVDADEQNDWEANFIVDLAASRQAGRAVVRFDGVQTIAG
ncbi:MAG TPA: DUF3516 domain-containing protein, partial [Opitutaceae bacterium]